MPVRTDEHRYARKLSREELRLVAALRHLRNDALGCRDDGNACARLLTPIAARQDRGTLAVRD
jgi:hypothetical protein